MGGGRWTQNTHTARASAKRAAGMTTFDYSDTQAASVPRTQWKAHETLDPKATNDNGDHAGQITREAYDNVDNPESVPIAVFFDVTGSMGYIPRQLQQKLPELHGLLLRKGYVEYPQILFGAIGDANSDRVPLQVGQFEADNRMDEHLENIFLEGNGGGQGRETYELAAHFLARHTDLDSLNKRGKKGYCFFMGDEAPYDTLRRSHIRNVIGGPEPEVDLDTKEVFEELKERYEVFFLFVTSGSYREEDKMPAWRELLGERALTLDDPDAVCETIALTIGLLEGTVGFDDGLDDIREISDESSAEAAGKALATVGASAGAVAVASGDLPMDDSDSGSERL